MRASVACIASYFLLAVCSRSSGFWISSLSRRRRWQQTLASRIERFTTTTTCHHSVSKSQDEGSASDEETDDDKWNNFNPIRQEQSRLPDYVASFLDSNKKDEEDEQEEDDDKTYTHMIGVPMDDCHELMLELESVQRAILYHCPLLVHACIAPAVTRMPLLYVSAPSTNKLLSPARVTSTLHEICNRVVQQQVYVKQTTPSPHIDPENEDEVMGNVNSEGYKPLLLSFQNLEIDGPGNQCLSTVAKQDEGSARLIRLVEALRKEIEGMGWKVSFPPDDHSRTFRPRVPFMRLPDSFHDLLDPLEDGQEEWMRTSDQGGNGISPIFWCQWWEDDMAKYVRLGEIGIYPRQPAITEGLGERAFYIPHETTPLPKGNDALTKAEARHRAYNDKRMAEAEGRTVQEDEDEERTDTLRDAQVQQERERLESIYVSSTNACDATMIDGNVKKKVQDSVESVDASSVDDMISASSTSSADDPGQREKVQNEVIDKWTEERIRKTVEARASLQAKRAEGRDKKPSIEDNEIFQRYKKNTLVPKTENDTEKSSKPTELPDFPSRENFVGIWRVVTSPTGFPEESGEGNSKSDNIILRVDGTIAGGPTLDRETQQKAAGGTWKLIEPTGDEAPKLRVRLVIPPKKERILVMEGEATRFTSQVPLSKTTFGIPELEEAARKLDNDMEDLMHCGGAVWVEDAITGKNRDEIGTFSLMKLQSPMEPGKYVITIPRPVRSQD